MGLLDGFSLGPALDAFKNRTNSSMREVRSNTLTPIDQTAARLEEGLALKNPSDTSLKENITAYKSQIVESLDGIIGAVSGGLLNTKAITRAIRVDGNGVRLDTDALITAAGSQLGFNVWGKAGVQNLIAEKLGAEINRLTGLNLTGLIQVRNADGSLGGFSVNRNWRTQMGQATMDMVRDITDVDEYIDLTVQTSLYNTIIYNSALFGMRDSYGGLWDKYPYPALRQDAFIEAMQVMIDNGDIESINDVLNRLNTEGKNVLLNKYPDFIEKLFSNFSFAKDLHPEDYPALRDKLLIILETIGGKDWYKVNTGFGSAYNLGLVSDVSPDMKTLLLPVDYLIPFLCAAGLFKRESASLVLNGAFESPPIQIT